MSSLSLCDLWETVPVVKFILKVIDHPIIGCFGDSLKSMENIGTVE
jgi:hypothetical protein